MLLLWSSGMSSLQADLSCSKSSLVMFSERSLSREVYSAMICGDGGGGGGGAFKKDSDLRERMLPSLNLAFKPFENFDSDLDLKRENSG